ncbi:MAG TPA: holo-ACP synthase [Chloroflexia bacterium]|nr:holo-ACP synthase [Chloroflexia bacterium]
MPDEYVSPSSLAGLSPIAAGLSVADAMDGRLQCGVDLIEISRIQLALDRWGERFLRRVWTEREIAACRGRHRELAARFAAKEAASKALGTGIVGIVWRELEVLPDRRGKPLLFLHGQARARADELGLNTWALSITHSRDLACAFVVAYAAPSEV